MLYSKSQQYQLEPFSLEKDLEAAVQEVKEVLFGPKRVYLELKKKIGKRGQRVNIPDAYLLDLSSDKEPKLFLVENELNTHHNTKHIAVQILEFSLSYELTPHKVKEIVRDGLKADKPGWLIAETYARKNNFDNVDNLLDSIIHKEDSFNALLIIDELDDELKTVFDKRFKFPVEYLTIQKYVDSKGKSLYQFEPFMNDVFINPREEDPAELDTVIVPARKEGFEEVFLGENCWRAIRMHASMLDKIKYIAAYQVAPESAITHIAEVDKIEIWKDTGKYILYFKGKAEKIKPICLPKGSKNAPQAPRYCTYEKLIKAKTIEDIFK